MRASARCRQCFDIRDLLQVEDLFRTAKALMRTRPIYHSSDAAIRGHVFCSFLALVLRKELDERCRVSIPTELSSEVPIEFSSLR